MSESRRPKAQKARPKSVVILRAASARVRRCAIVGASLGRARTRTPLVRMPPFDPFTASIEEAQAQPDAYSVRESASADGSGAVWRWGGAQRLLANRDFYEANPLDGVAVCATHDLVMPGWLAAAFLSGFRKVAGHQKRTWDEAFGPAHPTGVNLAIRRQDRKLRFLVANKFSDMLMKDPTRPVNKILWQEIGDDVGRSATRTEELYREAVALGIGLTAQQIRASLNAKPIKPGRKSKPAGLKKRS